MRRGISSSSTTPPACAGSAPDSRSVPGQQLLDGGPGSAEIWRRPTGSSPWRVSSSSALQLGHWGGQHWASSRWPASGPPRPGAAVEQPHPPTGSPAPSGCGWSAEAGDSQPEGGLAGKLWWRATAANTASSARRVRVMVIGLGREEGESQGYAKAPTQTTDPGARPCSELVIAVGKYWNLLKQI